MPGAMSQTTIPRTPTPEALQSDEFSPIPSPSRSRITLSPRRHQVATTPPPSSQFHPGQTRFGLPNYLMKDDIALASPPPTVRLDPPITAGNLFGEVPTMDDVANMHEEELRRLIKEMIPALGEARVTAAHSKLQHSLLSVQTEEAIKRAEVDHEATRREVRILQEGSPVPHRILSPIASPQSSLRHNLHSALAHCNDLQLENSTLRRRLKSSKKLISNLDSENAELRDQTRFLRQRIKDNRDHLNDLQESGAMSLHATPQQDFATPNLRDTPRTPANNRNLRDLGSQTVPSRNPFDALLQAATADLNREPLSNPTSPNQQRQKRTHNHIRGALSLSSLPMPTGRRPLTSEGVIAGSSDGMMGHRDDFTRPETQASLGRSQARDDRESTISASDNEDDHDEEPAGSQASQEASKILRRSLLESQQGSPRSSHNQGKLTQRKLFGHVQKPYAGGFNPLKRKVPEDGYDESFRNSASEKGARAAADKIGLGIGNLHSPAR